MKLAILSLALAIPFSAFAGEMNETDIKIEGAYAFQPNPAAKNGAIFMRIDNEGETPAQLISAQTESAHMVQIHTNIMDGDIMKMEHLENGLEIPAHGCALLERGGYHIMLMGLNADFEEGQNISLTLTFDDGEELSLDVPVADEGDQGEDFEQCVRAEAAEMQDN